MKAIDSSVVTFNKNFSLHSHIGLGVSALNTQKVLRAAGLRIDTESVTSVQALRASLAKTPRTHVVISAPWIPTADLSSLCSTWPETQFFLNCHSNVGFLQADRNGVKLMREALELETGTHNFHVGGNSQKFVCWITSAFGVPCAYLPNLYYLDGHTQLHPPDHTGVLRIGTFGATRPLKNLMSAAGAALEIARDLRKPLEFWLSGARTEGGGETVLGAVQNLLANLPGVTLKTAGWQSWPQFRKLVGTMNLLLQPSYTESFNMVTADGISQGVPSVVSEAIDWVPNYWQASMDDVCDIARVGKLLLTHRNAAEDGLHSLIKHDSAGVRAWGHALNIEDLHPYKVPSKLAAA